MLDVPSMEGLGVGMSFRPSEESLMDLEIRSPVDYGKDSPAWNRKFPGHRYPGCGRPAEGSQFANFAYVYRDGNGAGPFKRGVERFLDPRIGGGTCRVRR